MSLRQQAKILGVHHSTLSRMISGKRPWNQELKARYEALVGTTFGTTKNTIKPASTNHQESTLLALAGARGSRTHHTSRRTAANGFEVRRDHQAPSAPKISKHQEK